MGNRISFEYFPKELLDLIFSYIAMGKTQWLSGIKIILHIFNNYYRIYANHIKRHY